MTNRSGLTPNEIRDQWIVDGTLISVTVCCPFGATGNDIDDDLGPINQAIRWVSSRGGGVVRLKRGSVHRCTDAVQILEGVLLSMEGATLDFQLNGDKEALQFRGNWCGVVGPGTINVNGVNLGGTAGSWHTPINVGQFFANVGYRNITLRNLTISGNRANGNGILVTADSENVTIDHITFPDSATIAIPILVHWGSDGALPPVLTTHPHNIRIRNIKCGAMTNASVGASVVYVSAGHNVKVENVYATRALAGVTVVAGDYGYSYAAASVQPMAMQGITVDGVLVEQCDGNAIIVNGAADNDAAHGFPLFSIPARIINVKGKGTGAASTVPGVRLYKCFDTEIINCEMSHFARGADVDEGTKRCKIRGGRYFNNWGHGINVDHAATNPEETVIEDVETYLNGQSGANSAGVFSGNAKRTKIVRGVHGHIVPANETTQIWAVRVSGGADASLIDVHTRSVKAGGNAYSLGSGATAYGEICEFRGCTGDGAAVANFRGGLDRVPVRRVVTTGNVRNTHLIGPSAPVAGAWQVGDEILFDAPVAAGKRGAVCTAAGTPGTWKSFGPIDP